jgi:hypothetical protein
MRWLAPAVLALLLAAVAPWPGPATHAIAAPAPQEATRLLSQQELADLVDAALAAGWEEQKLEPTAPADDATWLRRLSLDLCGSIPDRAEVERFLTDGATDKRSRKIDEYLADRRFAENLSYLYTNLLLASSGKDAERTKGWVQPWIESQIAKGVPYRELVHHVIADAGSTTDPGALSFILSYRDAIETIAGVSARTFLGLQIQCAQCHDHPFDKWKQADFNRFTGFFLDMRADHVPSGRKGVPLFRVLDMTPEWDLKERLHRIVAASRDKGEGGEMMGGGSDGAMTGSPDDTMVSDVMRAPPPEMAASRPGTESNFEALTELIKLCRRSENGRNGLEQLDADPKKFEEFSARLAPDARDLLKRWHDRRAAFGTAGYLDGTPYQAKENVPRRLALADWMTSADNPWFAKAAVNRMWKLLFAKGLTEPVDDLSAKDDRVATELLDRLATEFNGHGTDLRFLLGALARTRAYALADSVVPDEAERDRAERWFAAHAPRSFTPEQMTNSLLTATALEDANGRRSAGPADSARARLLDEMAGYFGTKGMGGNESFAANIPQALFLMNGGYADRGDGMRHSAMFAIFQDDKRSAAERLRPLFLATLGRPPTAAEAEKLAALALHAKGGIEAGFDDLYWSLLNSTEFHTNH